jgi:hypothetical protein
MFSIWIKENIFLKLEGVFETRDFQNGQNEVIANQYLA